MTSQMPLVTQFASPERASEGEVARQVRLLAEVEYLPQLTNITSNFVAVMNPERQIVYANRTMIDFAGEKAQSVYGKRLGEFLGCIHSEEVCGCGTTEYCSVCGMTQAVLEARENRSSRKDWRIIQKTGDFLEFRVQAEPLKLKGESFSLVAVSDIRDQTRRRELERIFFHDILNTAGNLQSFANLLKDATEEEMAEFREIIHHLAETLIDEIRAQQELLAAENRELIVHTEAVDGLYLLREVKHYYQNHGALYECTIQISPDARPASLISDRTLLRRVVGNMTKNAIEASHRGGVVTLNCIPGDNDVAFTVHNRIVMPRDVQLQVFQRSFSTKDPGRGLGTYSMKLLSERYLKGRVMFESTETGTTFSAIYPINDPGQGM